MPTAWTSKAFFGGWRHIDWDLVVAVEFPPKVRFARLVLPGDELIPLYAVQRGDAERSVQVMQQLRELFAASRPELDPDEYVNARPSKREPGVVERAQLWV